MYDGATMAAQIELCPDDVSGWWEPPPFRLDLAVSDEDRRLSWQLVEHLEGQASSAQRELAAEREHSREQERLDADSRRRRDEADHAARLAAERERALLIRRLLTMAALIACVLIAGDAAVKALGGAGYLPFYQRPMMATD